MVDARNLRGPTLEALASGQLVTREILEDRQHLVGAHLALMDHLLTACTLGRGEPKKIRLVPELLEGERFEPFVDLLYVNEIFHEFIMPEGIGGLQICAQGGSQ